MSLLRLTAKIRFGDPPHFLFYFFRRLDLNAFLSKGHMFQTEMRYYCRKFRIIEVPIHYICGSSTLNLRTVFRSLGILFRLPFQLNAKPTSSVAAKSC
jgi:hypothetical protein